MLGNYVFYQHLARFVTLSLVRRVILLGINRIGALHRMLELDWCIFHLFPAK